MKKKNNFKIIVYRLLGMHTKTIHQFSHNLEYTNQNNEIENSTCSFGLENGRSKFNLHENRTNLKPNQKMKAFQTVQNNLAVLGVNLNSAQSRLNRKLIKTCFIYYLSSTLATAFLFLEAEDFWQYTMNIYITTSSIMISSHFVCLIFKVKKFFTLIDDIENIFDKSMYFGINSLYSI